MVPQGLILQGFAVFWTRAGALARPGTPHFPFPIHSSIHSYKNDRRRQAPPISMRVGETVGLYVNPPADNDCHRLYL